ncbi:MAG: hypothetical protein H0T65_24850, partial [Deltaproteobacteria bacterium]|nr:hypothetical protein [Deltaproteobacteria bacterium]
MRSVVVALLIAACGPPAVKQIEEPQPRPEVAPPVVAQQPVPPNRPARVAFTVGPSPTSIAVHAGELHWT